MKRFLLIAAGTVGGLGAVLSVTPPQLGATDLGLGLDMGPLTTAETPAQTPAAAPTQSAVKPTSNKPSSNKPSAVKPNATKPSTSNPTATMPTKAATSTQTVPLKFATFSNASL